MASASQGSRAPGGGGGRPRVVVLTGPTAAGKSALALWLAEEFGGEIVSADSMQVYRHLDIGTAKPSPAERRRVRHHLVDVVDPDQAYQAGRFRVDALQAVEDICARGRVPLVVGGTALYLKVLLQGLAPGPPRHAEIRAALEAHWERGEGGRLWEELRDADPALAARVHPNDRTRVIRGLEVWRAGGQRLSELHAGHGFREAPLEALRVGVAVEREDLCRRIDRRVLEMFAAGWVREVERVLGLGYRADAPPLQAIGYRQICAHLQRGGGEGGLPELVAAVQRETRRFAKRQMTWFRRLELRWVAPHERATLAAMVKNFLQTPGARL